MIWNGIVQYCFINMQFAVHSKESTSSYAPTQACQYQARTKNTAASQLQKLLSFARPIVTGSLAGESALLSNQVSSKGTDQNGAKVEETTISSSSLTKPLREEPQKPRVMNKVDHIQDQQRFDKVEANPAKTPPTMSPSLQQDFRKQMNATTISFSGFPNKYNNTYDPRNTTVCQVKNQNQYQFRKKPSISQYSKPSAQLNCKAQQPQRTNHHTTGEAPAGICKSPRAVSPNSKVRLRDYLFMMNTSVSAAFHKRTQEIKQTQTTIPQELPNRSRISSSKSQQSLQILNRYHNEKYRVNKKEMEKVLKKEITDEVAKLKHFLQQSEVLVEGLNQIHEEDIPCWHQLRRMMTEANKKIGNALDSLKLVVNCSPSDVQSQKSPKVADQSAVSTLRGMPS